MRFEDFLRVIPADPQGKRQPAAVESLVYQGLTFNTLDINGRKNMCELLGVSESENKETVDIQGSFSPFYQNAKCFGNKTIVRINSSK